MIRALQAKEEQEADIAEEEEEAEVVKMAQTQTMQVGGLEQWEVEG